MFLKKARARRAILFLGVGAICTGVGAVRAGVVWYLDDYDGWAAAAGDVQTIDFNTLPDGSPSDGGTPITPDFNYTSHGVTFSGPVTIPFIAGNAISGFVLEVDSSPTIDPNWIIGELVNPSHAIATSYPHYGILSVFDEQGELIDSRVHGAFGTGYLGVISDVPIASFTMDRNSSFSILSSYHHGTIPEPASLIPVFAGSLCLLRARRGRAQVRGYLVLHST